jgi:stage III sporulation protein AG
MDISHITKIKGKGVIALILAAGFILLSIGIIFGGDKGESESEKPPDVKDAAALDLEYKRSLEAEIASICTAVKGVSNVSVLITLDGNGEYVYAQNTNTGGGQYVIADGGGLLIAKEYPKVSGIAVVCKGGADARIAQLLISMLGAAFDLPTSKIFVAGAE